MLSETLLAALGFHVGTHVPAAAAAGGVATYGLELHLEAGVTASPMWDLRGPMPDRSSSRRSGLSCGHRPTRRPRHLIV